MASNPEQDRQELLDAIEELTHAVKDNSDKLDDAVKKQVSSRDKDGKERKKLLQGNIDLNKTQNLNTLRLGGVIRGMFSLHGMLGNVRSSNDQLVKSLAQAGQLTRQNYGDTLRTFRANNVSMTQAVAAFGDVVSMGMTRFGKDVLLMTGQLKVLGIQTKGLLQNVRFNTEVLGTSIDGNRTFAEQMVSSAMRMGTSVDGLVQAVNSMRQATTNVAAELGPTTAKNMQIAAAMLGQSTNEGQKMITDFMTSIMAGPEAFMKAGRLGVTAGVGMSPMEIAQMTVAALGRVRDLAPTAGAGAQHVFAGLEQFNIISREDVVLSRMRNINIKKLTDSQLKEATANVSRMSFEQAWQNALFSVQEFAMKAVVGIANMIHDFGKIIPMIAVVATSVGLMVGFGGKTLAAIKGLASVVAGIAMWIKGGGMFLQGAGAKAGGALFSSFGATVAGGVAAQRIFSGRMLASMLGRLTLVGAGITAVAMLGNWLMSQPKKDASSGIASLAGLSAGLSDSFMSDFKMDRDDAKAQRQESIKIQEEQLGIMKGGLSKNPSESPLYALTAEMSRNILGLNRLVELAEDGNDMARGTLNNSVLNKPIGILKPGG